MSNLISAFAKRALNSRKTHAQTTPPNCWEFYNCPEDRLHNCAAFLQNAGRRCWQVAGTLCEGRVQSIHAMKIGGCQKCDFYIQVRTKRV